MSYNPHCAACNCYRNPVDWVEPWVGSRAAAELGITDDDCPFSETGKHEWSDPPTPTGRKITEGDLRRWDAQLWGAHLATDGDEETKDMDARMERAKYCGFGG